MKNLILLLALFGTLTASAQFKDTYRVTLKKAYKGAVQDTVYLKVRLVQMDVERSTTWVSLNEYKNYSATKSDSLAYWRVSPPVEVYISNSFTSFVALSDTIRKQLAIKYKVNLARVTKL